ncbi:glycosyltransferase, partial [Pseudorhodobacter sp.]|uniref:glycosyltransferase n=1 Tax=Pseudorhodobacter sp. TaxID=1934400 RepID=UPI00264A1C82
MSTQPIVSVIIPTYNAAHWLAEAVQSALDQTCDNIEVLVFDNASTDATPEVMAGFTDPRCVYVRAALNVGMAGNITRGIKAAKGRFFMVLGADDILEPGFLAAAVARLKAEPAAKLLHGRAIWIDGDGNRVGVMGGDWPARSSGDEAFLRCFTEGFCFSTMIMHTAPVKTLGAMDEQWGLLSDTWLFLKMSLQGDVLFMNEPLARYRVHENSVSFELYADGKMFDDHLAGLEQAFAWPEAQHLQPEMRQARLAVAQQALDTLHMTRLGSGFAGICRKTLMIVRAEPHILLRPKAWARFGFAALPASAIRTMRNARRVARR